MKKLLSMLLVLLLTTPCVLAESSVHWIDGGNADRVHLRAKPSASVQSLGLYFTGTDVIVIEDDGAWAWVMVGDVDGYIMSEYLTRQMISPRGPWYRVDNPSSTWVNQRMSPSMKGMVIMRLDNGTAVQLLGETADGWSYVSCDGVLGYIMTSLISPMPEKPQIKQPTTILSDATGEGYIHQYVAPNGQAIFFTAEMEEPYVTFDDVNFDGLEDVVVMTVSGASNAWFKFFVYDGARDAYVFAHHGGDAAGLPNYQLHPESGVVSARATNGYAGALHVWNLYRWAGTDLKLIRSATSDEWSESSFDDETYTQVIRSGLLHITVRDYTNGYDNTVLFDQVITLEDTEYRDIFWEEEEALWQGLR